ncbi:aminotransferase class I/II-fold pyridoxal phosphate-dependent enzyme [Adlercreutzia murintestinalis]|uniref:aminotransferase class I/II-fold pyridoxal phosphate-dependent enzyme n=1 Tax=Adlercreutzia murintestinalis TaxID=2941325 RepID=UPI0020403679|nr:aminotransferase class I/II-fold pyridoxal phosphate-dependent enzyme [Adlercreutzia murintestinalis]
MTAQQREAELAHQRQVFDEFKAAGLALDMSRGKPCAEQLDLSTPMLSLLQSAEDCFDAAGLDCRNYGVIDGIPEAKQLMAHLLDDEPDNVFVFGNASLTAMHDAIARCLDYGCLGSRPWASYDQVSFICPVPGYDRHFAILEQFGIKMLPVTLGPDGPDMDEVERLVASDERVKGIWCVPKYSNPSGITYSDEVVRRLAKMPCAAADFRIFWDNAYCVHHLCAEVERQDQVLDIGIACQEAGTPDRYLKFASTSKITFPGAGVAAMACSTANLAEAKRLCGAQMIGHDKLNQLRHARFLPTADALAEHMNRHATILRPKFQLVQEKLQAGLNGLGIATWTDPHGGYFVSFDGLPGTAKRTVALAREAGVVLTGAGATWPYADDPQDRNIRIAPTMPPLEDLDLALDIFVCCARLAALETLAE